MRIMDFGEVRLLCASYNVRVLVQPLNRLGVLLAGCLDDPDTAARLAR